MPFTTFDSPLGELTLVAGDDGALRHLYFPGTAPGLRASDRDPDSLAVATEQLERYFRGELAKFDLALEIGGTAFQHGVWSALQAIPYGTTTTYGALARQLDAQPRAVGAAVGATPIPIIVPCHRVIGSDGSLTGYGGGLPRKRALLDLEAGVLPLAPV
jgi:methylated-DNA-[protein]-cysteine S-methyltransferase